MVTEREMKNFQVDVKDQNAEVEGEGLYQLTAEMKEALRDFAPEDPWEHRAGGMKCHTCMWFVGKGGGRLGRCRRRAPTMSGYPVVFVHDWCGDHKLDENKMDG